MQSALDKLAQRNPTKLIDKRQLGRYGNLIVLVDYKTHKTNQGDFKYINSDLNLSIKYTTRRHGRSHEETLADITESKFMDSPDEKRFNFPFAPLLKIAFEEYLNLTRVKD